MIQPKKISFPAMFAAVVMGDASLSMNIKSEVTKLALAVAEKHIDAQRALLEKTMEVHKLRRHWLIAWNNYNDALAKTDHSFTIAATMPAWSYLQAIPSDQICCLHALQSRQMSDGLHLMMQNAIVVGVHERTKSCSQLQAEHLIMAIKQGYFSELPIVYQMKNGEAHFVRKLEIRQFKPESGIEPMTQTYVITNKTEWRLE
jgi:hypothetical protein